MEILPHQQRVIEEKQALDEKIGKLQKFLAGKALVLPEEEMRLLVHQHRAMVIYSDVLAQRLTLWGLPFELPPFSVGAR